LFYKYCGAIFEQPNNKTMTNQEFDTVVTGFSSSLRPFALNLTKNMEEANDLIQDTMFRALSNKDKFQDGTNLKAWLFTIMKNIFINNYRRKVKRNTIIDTTDNLYYLNSSEALTDNAATAKFVMDDMKAAIRELSEEFRVPFMMHFEGYKYHEIADELRLPLGTVKSRIFFARKELKDKLHQYKRE
jgi:RNA polymerase sigma-70 factor, ECF subfamily